MATIFIEFLKNEIGRWNVKYLPNGVKVIFMADIKGEPVAIELALPHSHVSLLQSQFFERLFRSISKAIVPNGDETSL